MRPRPSPRRGGSAAAGRGGRQSADTVDVTATAFVMNGGGRFRSGHLLAEASGTRPRPARPTFRAGPGRTARTPLSQAWCRHRRPAPCRTRRAGRLTDRAGAGRGPRIPPGDTPRGCSSPPAVRRVPSPSARRCIALKLGPGAAGKIQVTPGWIETAVDHRHGLRSSFSVSGGVDLEHGEVVVHFSGRVCGR